MWSDKISDDNQFLQISWILSKYKWQPNFSKLVDLYRKAFDNQFLQISWWFVSKTLDN